jgi:hypothetical protein
MSMTAPLPFSAEPERPLTRRARRKVAAASRRCRQKAAGRRFHLEKTNLFSLRVERHPLFPPAHFSHSIFNRKQWTEKLNASLFDGSRKQSFAMRSDLTYTVWELVWIGMDYLWVNCHPSQFQRITFTHQLSQSLKKADKDRSFSAKYYYDVKINCLILWLVCFRSNVISKYKQTDT